MIPQHPLGTRSMSLRDLEHYEIEIEITPKDFKGVYWAHWITENSWIFWRYLKLSVSVVELLVPYIDKEGKDKVWLSICLCWKCPGFHWRLEPSLFNLSICCLLGSGYILFHVFILSHVFSLILITAFRGIFSLQLWKLVKLFAEIT